MGKVPTAITIFINFAGSLPGKKKEKYHNKKLQIKLQWNRIKVLPNAQKHLLR